jgi:cation transporter-like permease
MKTTNQKNKKKISQKNKLENLLHSLMGAIVMVLISGFAGYGLNQIGIGRELSLFGYCFSAVALGFMVTVWNGAVTGN